MPVGDVERAFQHAAAADGIQLDRARVHWLNQRGHLGLPDVAATARQPLQTIFEALGGQQAAQAAKALTSLPGDFIHTPSGTFIEVDEHQHFTSFRRRALLLYPDSMLLGFSLTAYLDLCDQWSPRADKYRRTKAATGFGPGGRQRQRAYHDSLRDIASPAIGHPPVIRVPILDDDGAGSYARIREQLHALDQK